MEKTVKVADIIGLMEKIAPPYRALDFDHIGLMTGASENEAHKILLCLDLDRNVLNEAIEKNADMVITHHPLIFNAMQTVSYEDVRGALVSDIIKSNISVYSAHTNLDFAEEGVNYSLLKRLGAENICPDASRTHFTGTFSAPFDSALSFLAFARERLEAPFSSLILPPGTENRKIKKIGGSCGAYPKECGWAYENNIDLMITGDIRHEDGIDLSMENFPTVSVGHFSSEIWGVHHLKTLLEKELCEKGFSVPKDFVSVSEAGKNPFGYFV